MVTKAAIEPVWYLPGVAKRFGCTEADLRRVLFEETGGMYPELVTRSDLEVFLPPIGGQTVYIFGNPRDLANPDVELTARVHDECNGSDVFGSDICTCRPYLTHAIEECIQGAQRGGVGLVAYSRKEGRALGEVTKFLVYNARKRQVGGDTADQYFARTECVAGVQDMRFQELMPDVLHWLGITQDPPAGVDEQHEVRRHHRLGHRGRRARQHPGRTDSRRRAGRDRRQDGGRLLHAGPGAGRRRTQESQGPGAAGVTVAHPRGRSTGPSAVARAAQHRRHPRPRAGNCWPGRGAANRRGSRSTTSALADDRRTGARK